MYIHAKINNSIQCRINVQCYHILLTIKIIIGNLRNKFKTYTLKYTLYKHFYKIKINKKLNQIKLSVKIHVHY